MELYKQQADDLHAGRTPRETDGDGLTVAELCNRFLTAKKRKVEANELTARSFNEYRQATDLIISNFGKRRLVFDLAADDFESLRACMAESWGPMRLGKFVQCIRTAFKYAFESGLIDRPVKFGPEFKRPSADTLRRHRAANGKRLFEAMEIRQLLDGKSVKNKSGKIIKPAGASLQLRAMILLGINCGFGNHDVAELAFSAVDLRLGIIDFPRPKTGINRRCCLWPETVKALKSAIADRNKPTLETDAAYIFITKRGNRWIHGTTDAVGAEFTKVTRRLCIKARRGQGFYSLRHTFRTIADSTKDFPAIRLIMGHGDGSVDALYREHIDDTRIKFVTAHVRQWLFAP